MQFSRSRGEILWALFTTNLYQRFSFPPDYLPDVLTPLRNWFNEFYARDTSKKIRTVKQAKAQRGERVNGTVPYGYVIDPNDRNHLLPAPEAADIVRQIFMMYVRGDRMRDIQNWLLENKVVTVSELQYRRTGSERHPRPYPDCIYNWPDKTLYDILTRKEYLGHTITGKSHKVAYKSKKARKNPADKQYFFPNTHSSKALSIDFLPNTGS